MQMGCFPTFHSLSPCYEFARQTFAITIIKLDAIRGDFEAFQKACLIALSVLRGINFHCHTHYFPNLIRVLDTAPALDFYGVCRLPRFCLYSYVPQNFDEYALLDQLEVILCDNWCLGTSDDQGQNRDPRVSQFAQDQLNAFLENMVDNDAVFRNEEEVRTILHNWLEKTLEAYPEEDFDSSRLDLQDLIIPLKPTSRLDTLITYLFIIVDIACVPDFLQWWGLIDLAPYANFFGRLPILSWASHWSLDDWIWGTAGVGYVLLFLQAVHSLSIEKLTPEEVKDTKWLMVAALAESLYCFSIVQNRDPRWINCLALIAKSLGLIAFLIASKPTFFKEFDDHSFAGS